MKLYKLIACLSILLYAGTPLWGNPAKSSSPKPSKAAQKQGRLENLYPKEPLTPSPKPGETPNDEVNLKNDLERFKGVKDDLDQRQNNKMEAHCTRGDGQKIAKGRDLYEACLKENHEKQHAENKRAHFDAKGNIVKPQVKTNSENAGSSEVKLFEIKK